MASLFVYKEIAKVFATFNFNVLSRVEQEYCFATKNVAVEVISCFLCSSDREIGLTMAMTNG